MSHITLNNPLCSINNDCIELIIWLNYAEFYRVIFSFFKRRNSGVWRYKCALSDIDNINLLIVQTFSKSRALAGLRIGYAFGSEQLIWYLNAVKNSFNSYTMNRLVQVLGVASVRDKEYFERTNTLIFLFQREFQLAQAF